MKIQLTEFVQEIKLGAKKHEFIKKIKKVIYKILNYIVYPIIYSLECSNISY